MRAAHVSQAFLTTVPNGSLARHFIQSSALIFSPTAFAEEPDEYYQRAKTGIDRRENPWLGLVKQNFVQPVFDKCLRIAGLSGPAAHFVFPDGQWAELPEPGL